MIDPEEIQGSLTRRGIAEGDAVMESATGERPRWRIRPILGLISMLFAGIWAVDTLGWTRPSLVEIGFDALAHMFYEQPVLAAIRRPTQLVLVRVHLGIWLILAIALQAAWGWLGTVARRFGTILALGYLLRAVAWIAGGNEPLVPGDSCHYLEVSTSIFRGEGPVKHYVESFFADYPVIRQGRGVLDDWATPLYPYTLAIAYRLCGVVPGETLEATVAVAKGTSFVLNLLCLPALFGFASRRFGTRVALASMALLAILPVHVIYAGMALRESLVALTSILAVWALTETWAARGAACWGWAIAAGLMGGLAILSRNTAMALVAAGGAYALLTHGRRCFGPYLAAALVLLAVIAPWAWMTYNEYGEPFYTYTKYFPYNFSWTIHHYEKGNVRAADFYTAAQAPAIVRVKIKAMAILAGYSTMILGVPVVAGFFSRVWNRTETRHTDRLVALLLLAFVAGTLANVADVTQVAQLGRYFLPVYALMIPTAVAGLLTWLDSSVNRRVWPLLAVSLTALVWADPTWAYDSSWFVKPYQMHLAGLKNAGAWIKRHPDAVPKDARVMTWYPWELRVLSDRTTILMPRSYYPPHIQRTIGDYGVTHVLWGSFDPPPHTDPVAWGSYLEQVRVGLGLTDDRELYRSPARVPYPVRLYSLPRGLR